MGQNIFFTAHCHIRSFIFERIITFDHFSSVCNVVFYVSIKYESLWYTLSFQLDNGCRSLSIVFYQNKDGRCAWHIRTENFHHLWIMMHLQSMVELHMMILLLSEKTHHRQNWFNWKRWQNVRYNVSRLAKVIDMVFSTTL